MKLANQLQLINIKLAVKKFQVEIDFTNEL